MTTEIVMDELMYDVISGTKFALRKVSTCVSQQEELFYYYD